MSLLPRMTEEERAEWLRNAEAAGWRPRELCACPDPRPVFGGGSGFYITSMCGRCLRRLRPTSEVAREA